MAIYSAKRNLALDIYTKTSNIDLIYIYINGGTSSACLASVRPCMGVIVSIGLEDLCKSYMRDIN